MGERSKKAVEELREIASGQSASMREFDELEEIFRIRMKRILSNLPDPRFVEITLPSLPDKE